MVINWGFVQFSMSPQSSSSTPAAEDESSSSRNKQQQTFDFIGLILRKKYVNANFIKLAIQQPNHIKSTTIYIPRNESLIQYHPSDIKNNNFLYLDATIHVTGYSFIKDDMEMHHVEQCSLIKCAPNVKMIKEILSSLPNYCNTSSLSSTYADIFNMESQEELSTLLLSMSTKKKSQKAIVMTIMEHLSGKKKVVKWRPGRIKAKDLEILQQKEAEGRGGDTMNQLWQLCQPCQSLNNDEQMPSSFDTKQMESSSQEVINLPTGSDHVISANGKLTRREYLVTKKNNQTQWFVERIARLSSSKDKQPYWRFLDVGGGRGDLAVAIALHFDNAHITVVDCNESCIAAGKVYATKCNVDDRIEFVYQNFSDYYAEYVNDDTDDRIDVVVALHACGDLSDMALSFAQQNECAFVICPCCYPKRYLAPFTPFWHGLCKNADGVDSLSRMVELDNESKDNESRRAMIVINSMRRQAFEDGCVKLEEFSNTISKRNIVLVKDSVS